MAATHLRDVIKDIDRLIDRAWADIKEDGDSDYHLFELMCRRHLSGEIDIKKISEMKGERFLETMREIYSGGCNANIIQ